MNEPTNMIWEVLKVLISLPYRLSSKGQAKNISIGKNTLTVDL